MIGKTFSFHNEKVLSEKGHFFVSLIYLTFFVFQMYFSIFRRRDKLYNFLRFSIFYRFFFQIFPMFRCFPDFSIFPRFFAEFNHNCTKFFRVIYTSTNRTKKVMTSSQITPKKVMTPYVIFNSRIRINIGQDYWAKLN